MERLLKVSEAAAALSVARSTLYEMLGSGELRSVRIARRGVRIPASEIARFVAERLTTTTPAA